MITKRNRTVSGILWFKETMLDVNKFINEVKLRPGLYSAASDGTYKANKKVMWQEVASASVPNWNTLDDKEKTKLLRELKIRWKSMRDQFRREVRMLKCSHNHAEPKLKKKKYIYFDQLLFLLPVMQNRRGRPPKHLIDSNYTKKYSESNASSQDDVVEVEMNGSQDVMSTSAEPSNITEFPDVLQEISGQQEINSHEGINPHQEMIVQQGSSAHEYGIPDKFGNRQFLMSLAPFMDLMTEDEIFDCRMRLMEDVRFFRSLRSTHQMNISSPQQTTNDSVTVADVKAEIIS